MGCGCKKNKKTEQQVQAPAPTTPQPTNEELKNQIKVVVNKYNKLKK